MTEYVDEVRLRKHVEALASDIGERNVSKPESLAAASSYIEAEWRTQGYDVARQVYEADGVACANLEVTRRAEAANGKIILIGAHYDTVSGSPGADDNASGIAALLELSRLFAEISPRLAIRFVAFTNEEPPYHTTPLQGSAVHARAARERGDNIDFMVSLEMLGYYRNEPGSQRYPPLFRPFFPSAGNFIGVVSNFRSHRAKRRLTEAFRRHSDFPIEHLTTFEFVPGVSWSDHAAFWKQGYHGLMVTDTAFYRNPHYHTLDDPIDKIACPEFHRVTEGLFLAFAALAT